MPQLNLNLVQVNFHSYLNIFNIPNTYHTIGHIFDKLLAFFMLNFISQHSKP
uniref:Uncharacterized protein n=1 Tax=Rhizophora mucronata TaxID=61149 RepID=A0A2P2PDG1_RHIMU